MEFNRSDFTVCYLFTRVNPTGSDYDLLVGRCRDVGACMGYESVRSGDVLRLVGFIALPREVPHLCRLFPNFNLTRIYGTTYV